MQNHKTPSPSVTIIEPAGIRFWGSPTLRKLFASDDPTTDIFQNKQKKKLAKLCKISNKYKIKLDHLIAERTQKEGDPRNYPADHTSSRWTPTSPTLLPKLPLKKKKRKKKKQQPKRKEAEKELAFPLPFPSPRPPPSPPSPPYPQSPSPESPHSLLLEPTYQAHLLDRYSLCYILLQSNKPFRTFLWDSCVLIYQYINDRRVSHSVQRLFVEDCKRIPKHLTPTEFRQLLEKMGFKIHLLSWYDILWIARCIGRLHDNGSLPIVEFDHFSKTFWHKTGRMQTVFRSTTYRTHSSAFTLSCLTHAVNRASARITNQWDVHKGYCMNRVAAHRIHSNISAALTTVSNIVSQQRTSAWRIETCWRRYCHQNRYMIFRNGWIALQYECRKWRSRRRCFAAIVLQKYARCWTGRSNYAQFQSAVVALQHKFVQWRIANRNRAATCIQSFFRSVLPRRRYLNYRFYCIVSVQLKFRYWCYINQKRNAVCIQKTRRGYNDRFKFRRFKHVVKCFQVVYRYNRNKKRKHASIKLQSWFRGCVARQIYMQTRRSFATFALHCKWYLWKMERMQRRYNAAVLLQELTRYIKDRVRYVRVKQNIVQMQRTWRYHNTRLYKSIVIESFARMVNARMKWLKTTPGVLLIQKIGRGYVEVKRLHAKINAIVLLQSLARCWITRIVFNCVVERRRMWRWCLQPNETVTYVNDNITLISKSNVGIVKKKLRTVLTTSQQRMLLLSNVKMTEMQKMLLQKSNKTCKKKSNWFVDQDLYRPVFSLFKDQSKPSMEVKQVEVTCREFKSTKWLIEFSYDVEDVKNEIKGLNMLILPQKYHKTWRNSWFVKYENERQFFNHRRRMKNW